MASIGLVTLGCVFVLLAELAIYSHRNLENSDRFADRAVSALDDKATRDEVGALVAEQLETANPDLIAFRAVIEAGVSSLAGTEPFQAALRTGVTQAHRQMLGKDKDDAVVTIANFGVLATETLRALAPKVAKEIPPDFRANLIEVSEGGFGTDLVQLDTGSLPVVLPMVALLLLSLGVFAANDRRAGLTGAAAGIAAVGLIGFAGFELGRSLVAGAASSDGAEAAARSLWQALLGDLRDWSLTLCFAGAIVAGAASSLLRPVDAAPAMHRIRVWLERDPSTTLGRVLRGLVLLAVGIFVLVSPDVAVHLLAIALGLALAFAGATELLDLIAGPAGSREERRERTTSVLRTALLALVGVIVAAVVVVVALARDDTGEPAAPDGCNGSAALCDRTIDEVVFPATHNSMAAANYPGFLFPMHENTIPQQLDDGIRGLLIDAYYGYPGRRVYTDFDRGPNKLIEQTQEQFGPQFRAAADRVRSTIAQPDGESKLYLCHGFCEMGALDLVHTLRDINGFLEQNPNEIVMIVIEDYVKPADIVDAFERSGLADHAYDGPLGPDFPTLQDLIDSDKRLIVLAENRAGEAPWYREAYDFFQETGYDFSKPEDMDCAANRGAKSNPLFMINNWINTDPAALPSNAKKVNAHDFLLDRAHRCEHERGLLPNVIAVDFYEQGDLLGVAEELNREEGEAGG